MTTEVKINLTKYTYSIFVPQNVKKLSCLAVVCNIQNGLHNYFTYKNSDRQQQE